MMEQFISKIVTGCFWRSAQEVSKYLEKHFGICSAFENDDSPDDEFIAKSIDHVDNFYLDYHGINEICGLPSPIIRFFGEGDKDKIYYDPCSRFYSREINYPCHEKKVAEPEFLQEFLGEIANIDRRRYSPDEYYMLLAGIFEDYGSMLSVNGGSSSLFELTKLRAGLATALYCFSKESGIAVDKCTGAKCVISCSFDFLGIKDFKFIKENSTGIRRETAASLFIDLLRENVLDEFLSQLGISRCNLVFSGGRHLHMFLPNTESVRVKTEEFIHRLNDWLVRLTGETLFVSYGMCALSSLGSDEARGEDYYLKIFTKIANHKALMESHKYSAAQIQSMNSGLFGKGPDLDVILNSFANDKYYVVSDRKKESSLEIIEGRYLYASDTADVQEALRVYESNYICGRKRVPAIKIWHQKLYEGSAEIRTGRFMLIRLDIDGFNTHMLGNPKGNASPYEKMELSKHFAFFMKRDVSILADRLSDNNNCICTIHEGADDLFILMSEKVMSSFVKELVLHYERFTGGCVSFSAGISEFDPERGFAYSCDLAQQLMDRAKKNPGKNSVVLMSESAMMKWKDFFSDVETTETIL